LCIEFEVVPFTAGLHKVSNNEAAQVEAAEEEEVHEAPSTDQPEEPLEPLNTESLEGLLKRAAPIQSKDDDEKTFAVRGAVFRLR
jgi:hypothetical protein